MYQDNFFDININSEIKSFYSKFDKNDFNKINYLRIIKLQKASIELNQYYNNDSITIKRTIKYIKLMNNIKINPSLYGAKNKAEEYILFMFSVDPEFDAYIIQKTSNTKKEIESKMKKQFGVFDIRLFLIEKYFIKYFATKKFKEEVNQKVLIKEFY